MRNGDEHFRRCSPIPGLGSPFSPISTDEARSTGDVFFAVSRDEPGAVTFTVAGRVQLGGDCV